MSTTTTTQPTRKHYWRSLDELRETPEFVEFLQREFPESASEYPRGVSRRRWLQLMGASLALGGMTGCWKHEKIAPFTVRPQNRVPGVQQRFATCWNLGTYTQPLVVTCFDGRPIKVEGNPQHPEVGGGTSAFAQAAVLDLYDPDRGRDRTITQREDGSPFNRSWADFTALLRQERKKYLGAKGKGFAILAEPNYGPSFLRLRQELLEKMPEAQWVAFSAVDDVAADAASRQVFDRPLRTHYDLDQAEIILTLDADLLGSHPAALSYIRDWAKHRAPEEGNGANRLYAVESQFSSTGAASDHRLPLKSSEIGPFLSDLSKAVENPPGKPEDVGGTLTREKMIAALADDLVKYAGRSVVAVGPSQPAAVHALAHQLNSRLGNTGKTVFYTVEPGSDLPGKSGVAAVEELIESIESGDVETLLVLGGNPAYALPGPMRQRFVAALENVGTTIRFSETEDETAALCDWVAPATHAFEEWGDGRTYGGTLCCRQPLIAPLHEGKSFLELLSMLSTGEYQPGDKIVQATMKGLWGEDGFDKNWRQFVHDGFTTAQGTELTPADVQPSQDEVEIPAAAEGYELVIAPSAQLFDGRFANNAWMQEAPEPMTKVTWDNVAVVGPSTADRLGVETGSLLKIAVGDTELTVPAFVLPGQADGSIGLAIGYGRTAAGHVGGWMPEDEASELVESVGVDINPLRPADGTWLVPSAEVTRLPGSYIIATSQDHHTIDNATLEKQYQTRIGELVREGSLAEYEEHPDFAQHMSHHPPLESLWKEPSYDGYAWGMAIDLTKCVGCNACVVACQSENNVPVVGKDQVHMGREMHWLRVDRYFAGEPEHPTALTQPLTCHHCENAPCEQVCPVAATVHSYEGLNDMAYNRCIGTRYCANNCPYKVRRFNYFDYNAQFHKANQILSELVLNPEVTVRSRGVMEKCTYCVQRIQEKKIIAKNEQRPVRDGEIVTACQQACPADAITFGDLNSASSQVTKAHSNPRAYAMLAELNVKPRTRYLARIRNLHPWLATPHDHDHAHGGAGEEHAAAH